MDKEIFNSTNMTHRWWKAMFLSSEKLKKEGIYPASTAQKAQLKRCSTIDDAMLSEGFRNLWLVLPDSIIDKAKPQDIECWATIAAALVYVKEDSEQNLATAAAQKNSNEKSIVSELRFSQLQNSKTPDEFLRRMRRILQQIDGKTSVTTLINDIQQWFKEHYSFRTNSPANRIAVRWAMDYYRAAK